MVVLRRPMIGAIMDAGSSFPKAPVDFVVIRFSDLRVINTALAARARGLRYLLWPKEIYLSETRPETRQKYLETLRRAKPDMGWIFDLETNPDGSPLSGPWKEAFVEGLFEFRRFALTSDFMGLPRVAHITEDPFAEKVIVSRLVAGKHYPLVDRCDELLLARKVRGDLILAGSPRHDYGLLLRRRSV